LGPMLRTRFTHGTVVLLFVEKKIVAF
jgi:hypothetical protein